MDGKIANIQALRALAALAVLLSHLHAFETAYAPDPVSPAAFFYGFAGVDLFFVISGFVMVLASHGRARGAGGAAAFLFARVWRIYPAWWLFLLLTLLGVALFDDVAARLAASPLLPSLALWPMAPQLPLLQVGWTLTHELYFYLVFALTLLAPRRAAPVFLLLWAGIVVGGMAAGLHRAGGVPGLVFSPLTFEFLAGAVAGLLAASGRRRFAGAALALGAAGLVLGCLWMGAPTGEVFADMERRAVAYAIPFALLVYGAACVEAGRGWRAPHFLVVLGDWSYALYLAHFLVIAMVVRLWAGASGAWGGAWDNVAALALSLILSVVVAGVTFRLFERPVLRLGARLRARLFPAPPGVATGRQAGRIW